MKYDEFKKAVDRIIEDEDVVIAPNDEMTITVLGGLKFTELI